MEETFPQPSTTSFDKKKNFLKVNIEKKEDRKPVLIKFRFVLSFKLVLPVEEVP